eukprot:EG_transcript_16379
MSDDEPVDQGEEEEEGEGSSNGEDEAVADKPQKNSPNSPSGKKASKPAAVKGKRPKEAPKPAPEDDEYEKDESDEGSEDGSTDEEESKPSKSVKTGKTAKAPAKSSAKPSKPPMKGAKAPASKESKTTPIKATDVDKWILDFLNTRNRPYSPINLVDSSAGAIKKATAEKALAALHAAGKITCKDLKKQKVYMARQEDFEVPDADEVARMETGIKSLTEEVAMLERETKALASTLQQLQTQMSDEDLAKDIRAKSQAAAEMEAKLQSLRQGTVLVDEARKAKAVAQYEHYRAAWRTRKRMAKDIIDAVCGDAKRPKDLMEELGIETDEQLQVTLEGTELPLKKAKG